MLELSKFTDHAVKTEQQRWLKFFNEAEHLDDDTLPTWMQTPEMMQAMSTLKTFSDKERAYHAYQARQNYLREQRSVQRHLDDLEAKVAEAITTRDEALVTRDQERAAKEDALAEIERLKRQLRDADR